MEKLFSLHPGAPRLDTAPTPSRAPPGTPLVDMTLNQLKTAKYDKIVHMIETSKRDTELLKAQAVCRQQASLKLDTLFDNEIEARLGQQQQQQPQLVQGERHSYLIRRF